MQGDDGGGAGGGDRGEAGSDGEDLTSALRAMPHEEMPQNLKNLKRTRNQRKSNRTTDTSEANSTSSDDSDSSVDMPIKKHRLSNDERLKKANELLNKFKQGAHVPVRDRSESSMKKFSPPEEFGLEFESPTFTVSHTSDRGDVIRKHLENKKKKISSQETSNRLSNINKENVLFYALGGNSDDEEDPEMPTSGERMFTVPYIEAVLPTRQGAGRTNRQVTEHSITTVSRNTSTDHPYMHVYHDPNSFKGTTEQSLRMKLHALSSMMCDGTFFHNKQNATQTAGHGNKRKRFVKESNDNVLTFPIFLNSLEYGVECLQNPFLYKFFSEIVPQKFRQHTDVFCIVVIAPSLDILSFNYSYDSASVNITVHTHRSEYAGTSYREMINIFVSNAIYLELFQHHENTSIKYRVLPTRKQLASGDKDILSTVDNIDLTFYFVTELALSDNHTISFADNIDESRIMGMKLMLESYHKKTRK